MMLLLDIGNTSLKWATAEDGQLLSTGRFIHHDADYAACAVDAWGDLDTPVCVIVANVAGKALEKHVSDWCRHHWGVEPDFITSPPSGSGVVNAYPEPARLGADRWAALVGARRHAKLPACIVDCGSAITVDVIDGEGRHAGGQIMPGVAMLKRVLLENTAAVDAPVPGQAAGVLATDTAGAVETGARYMAAATLQRVLADIDARYEQAPAVLVTGGDADAMLSLLGRPVQHDPDIVLRGLAVIAEDKGTCQ